MIVDINVDKRNRILLPTSLRPYYNRVCLVQGPSNYFCYDSIYRDIVENAIAEGVGNEFLLPLQVRTIVSTVDFRGRLKLPSSSRKRTFTLDGDKLSFMLF